jgi:hypothetical protein
MPLIAVEPEVTLQMINAHESAPIAEWRAAFPDAWLLLEVTREDEREVYEGKLLATAEDPMEFLPLKKAMRAQNTINYTTKGVSTKSQPAIVV